MMTYLEYLQIKSLIDQEKQKQRIEGLGLGSIFLILGLIFYISLGWVIIPTMLVVFGIFYVITAYLWNFTHKKRMDTLNYLYKEKESAEKAAKKVFKIKELQIVLC